jgi:hypothetical protein
MRSRGVQFLLAAPPPVAELLVGAEAGRVVPRRESIVVAATGLAFADLARLVLVEPVPGRLLAGVGVAARALFDAGVLPRVVWPAGVLARVVWRAGVLVRVVWPAGVLARAPFAVGVLARLVLGALVVAPRVFDRFALVRAAFAAEVLARLTPAVLARVPLERLVLDVEAPSGSCSRSGTGRPLAARARSAGSPGQCAYAPSPSTIHQRPWLGPRRFSVRSSSLSDRSSRSPSGSKCRYSRPSPVKPSASTPRLWPVAWSSA